MMEAKERVVKELIKECCDLLAELNAELLDVGGEEQW
jgi:hypothetical protein